MHREATLPEYHSQSFRKREAKRSKPELMPQPTARTTGKVAYHVPCHLRVQNIGLKTRDVLTLVPGTTLTTIERCSGHDGTYAVKREYHAISMKIARPVVERVEAAEADHLVSDCPMAGQQIASGLGQGLEPENPIRLLRQAYGI